MSVHYTPSSGSKIEQMGAPIWERLFEMKVRYIDTLPDDVIREIGVLNTGNKVLNQQMHNDLLNVMITIDAMIEYYKRGVSVIFRNPQDTRDAYEIVNNYLHAWKNQIEHGLNLGQVPLEDLMLMDRWAESLYPVALKFGTAPRMVTSLFGHLLTGGGTFVTRDSFFGKRDEHGKRQAEPEAHASHAADLTRSIARLRSNWNT